MSRILTNNGAMVALQTLKQTNRNMADVQNQIATGLKVGTAKDNASSWAIAATVSTDVRALGKMSESLTSASAVVGNARAASEQMVDILKQVQEKVVQNKEPGADTFKIQAEVDELMNTVISIADAAQVNGINLVNNTTAQNFAVAMTRTAGAVGLETFTVTGVDLATGAGAAVTLVADAADETDLDAVETQIQAAVTAAATFGAAQSRIESQNSFLAKQADSLKTGMGALVDADMEAASARLQALQVQQQLGVQALSIANQAPQSVLSLFR